VNGAPAVVVTDQVHEFLKEFHDLCVHSFIDHRTASAYHPQANGLAERSVQTIKRALAKMAGLKTDSWEYLLP
jgi:transposase InsO family protein